MKQIKRVLSLLLVACMIFCSLPVDAYAADGNSSESATSSSTIIAMSDYQNSSLSSDAKKTVPQTIVNAMKSAGVNPELALIGGDYTDGSVGADGDDQSQASLKTELGNLTGILTSAWSGLPYYAIQGNHDYSGFLTDGTLDATGAYEQDNYIVYLINEDSFPWWQGNYGSGSSTTEDKATVTATTNALSTYLDSLISAGETRPVIIMSHVPMHWSERSTAANWYYDNIYANILFDAINEKAEELDILFLFGHNHSSTASGGDYDYEIGGALSYVAKGKSMKVPNGTDGTSNYTTETLNFTYMNAGYVGKYAGDTSNCSISAITIDSDSIDIARYAYTGEVYNETIALTAGSSSTDEGDSNSGSDTGDSNSGSDTGDSNSGSDTGDSNSGSDTDDSNSESDTDWVTIPGTSGTTTTGKFYGVQEKLEEGEIYLLVSDSSLQAIQDTGKTYTAEPDTWGSYETTIAAQNMSTASDTNGTYITIEDKSLMWKAVSGGISGYYYLQNVATGNYLQAGSEGTYGREIFTTSSNSEDYINFAVSSYNGIYAVQNSSNTSNYRYMRYSSSDTWFQSQSSIQSSNVVQLWKAETSSSGEATPDTYARLTGETVQSYDSSQATTASYVLSNLKIETSTDGSTVAETLSVTSDMVTWDKTFSGTSIGTYTGTVTYEGQTLGTVTVNISGTATEVEGDGDWVALPSGYVYTLDTDGMEPGSDNKYIIVGSDNDYALTVSGSTVGYAAVTVDGNTVTLEDPSIYEFYFQDNSSNESGSYLLTQNGTSTVYHSGGNLYYGSDNKGYWHIVAGSDAGEYRVYDTDGSNWHLNYGYVWSSESANRFSVSSNQRYVRLYKYTGGSADSSSYARLTGTLEQVYTTADATELSTVLGKVSIQTSTDQSTVAETVSVSSDMVTWNTAFDGSTAGTYTGTVTYEGQTLGTIKVTVTPVSVTSIKLITAEGSVVRGSKSNAITGGEIEVTYSDGTTATRNVTLGMLNNDGKTVGTYTGLTVTYGGKTVDGFTLTVNPKAGNNYPTYPNEGAVKVGKTGTGIDFQSSGVAKVELTASGVPMNQGVDVVVVLDTSSSMQETVEGFSSSRLTILRPAVNSLIEQLQTKREDGSDPDLDISIVCFNGFTGNGNSSTQYGSENYIEVQAYATPNAGGILTDESGDGWVDIMDLSTNWADEDQGNIDTGSGTNYDEGLLLAYKQLAAKQESWAKGETRQQFVVFMSDGAPFQYNGVYSNYTSPEWNNWLLGNYETEDDIPDTVTKKEYYTGYAAGQGQDHRIAEAIKGDTEQEYQIVTTTADTNGTTELKTVSGLGATMYSIGYLLADNGQVTNETQDIVLENIASGSEYYFDVDTAEELDNAFSNIAGSVLMSAYNAYYVDTMGSEYDIQLAKVEYASEGSNTVDSSIVPAIEIRQYTIWTRSEYEAGTITDLNLIGTRKTNSDGSYIYTTLETVTFNDAGTEAYTGGDTSNNILVDGVICANTFWYNTNTTSVMIDKDGDGTAEYELAAETFLWKIGTITTYELSMSYYVYLTGSMEGTREAGSYDTNESAVLYYDNYLENPCQKATVSPTLAWEAANVSYAFYLVNSDGQPVNMDGTVVPFANRVVIVNPTLYKEVLLNDAENVNSLEVISSGVLPDGYALYDESAKYTVTINSNSTGSWTIVNGRSTATTYVGDYSNAEAYSNALSVNNTDYDYTHTTVWFAVKWEPQALPDAVVIDYGLPVDIHVMTNDMFGNYGTLIGVANGDVTETASRSENSVTTTEAAGTYGSAKVIVPNEGANESNSVVRYTPANMEMNGYDVFTYSVQYDNSNYEQNNGYYYETVTVIPATTIYYEDEFVEFSTYTWDYNTNAWAENTTSQWKKVTDTTYNANADITQDEDRPDDINYAFDTVVDTNNIYGYDSAYTKCANYSLGSAMMAQVDYDNYAKAEFSFYGTGFDIISLTSNTTGCINVQVKDESGNIVRNTNVDTYYGYIQNSDGEWEVSVNDPNALYQVPVMEISGLTYGKYNVEVKAFYDEIYDHSQYTETEDGETISAEKYDFYLDAIRIYDPADDGNEYDADGNVIDSTIQNAYVADNEGWPIYEELRNNVIEASEDSGETEIAGIVFIDGIPKTASKADYISYGPNNELYLAKGQAIVFDLDLSEYSVATVQLGVKSADGKEVSYKIFDGESIENQEDLVAVTAQKVSTSTGMYYDITSLKDDTIVIYNSGESGTLSLTDIKITFTADPGAVENLFYVSTSVVKTVIDSMNKEAADTTFEPEEFDVSVPAAVTVGNKITVTTTTSADVAAISIDGEVITTYSVNDDGNRVWTKKVSTTETGSKEIAVVAYNDNGVASETKTVTVTVNTVETAVTNVIKSVVNKLKDLFNW